MSSNSTTHLIINADDFGLTDSVDRGIIRVWEAGIVTSTTVMINIPGAPQRVSAARTKYPDFPMGLHLNITTGRPVLPPNQVSTLVDQDGNFHSKDSLLRRLHRIDLTELHAELRAQAELLKSTGVLFDHIDYHHHMLARYGPFFDTVLKIASEFSVPIRGPFTTNLIHPDATLRPGLSHLFNKFFFVIIHPILSLRLYRQTSASNRPLLRSSIHAHRVAFPDHLIADFFGNVSVQFLMKIIQNLPAGVVELMVHPAYIDDDLRTLAAGYLDERERELEVLLDPSIKNALAQQKINLTNFSAVQL